MNTANDPQGEATQSQMSLREAATTLVVLMVSVIILLMLTTSGSVPSDLPDTPRPSHETV